jgi:hypothetical protein
MKNKIAVCISGELRYYNHPYVIDGYNKFIQTLNPDVFISVWDHIGESMNHGYIDPGSIKEKNDNILHDINKIYKNIVSLEIENYNDWFNMLSIKEKTYYTDNRFNNRTINSYTQLYKIYRANLLKQQHEQYLNTNYDIVIRMRPDNLFISSIDTNIEPETIYNINLLNTFYPRRIYDIFFYGDSKSMDTVCNSYTEFEYLLNNPFGNGLCQRDACRLLYLQAGLNSIVVESTKHRMCDVYRGMPYEEYMNWMHSWGGIL